MEVAVSETLAGNIVLMPHLFHHADGRELTAETKEMLDDLHMRKIAMADEVFILNVGGYTGVSTQNEMAYAIRLGKRIRLLEEHKARSG
jgi:hypothetical protein